MNPARLSPRRGSRRAVALVIVLAFIVLLTGLTVAFFSSSLLYRQISNSSASEAKVDLFAQGAVDTLVGDLKQEIAAGSNASSPAPGVMIYSPRTPLAAVPCPVSTPDPAATNRGLVNLVKRSAASQKFYDNPAAATTAPYDMTRYVPSNRAAGVSSVTPSLNGRSVSPARWNKALLLAKKTPASDTDLTPVGATSTAWAYAPDWVLVARDGSNPQSFNANMVSSASASTSVIGRYAYTIYDEGGLLDANVAAYPPLAKNQFGVTVPNPPYSAAIAYKNVLTFADLTLLPGFSALSSTGNPSRQVQVINSLVGWRNYATAKGTTGTLAGANYNFGTGFAVGSPLANYTSGMSTNTKGFLRTSNVALSGNGQTDRMFASRQELMRLLLNGIATQGTGAAAVTDRANLQNALQYLGTFSRGLNQPSYVPPAGRPTVLSVSKGGNNAAPDAAGVTAPLDDKINPAFLTVRVQSTRIGGRSDGTDLTAGEPLVKKRFALNRLAWLTYAGPITTDGTSYNSGLESTYVSTLKTTSGLNDAFLLQGTPANIQKYFGLRWTSTPSGNVWKYNVHNGPAGTGLAGSIMKLGDLAALPSGTAREADFFELLKASINVGSLGKSAVVGKSTVAAPDGYATEQVPTNYRYARDTSVDYQIIQIGANIIDQSDLDSYPTRIVFDDGSQPAQEFAGVEDLPYFAYVLNGMLRTQAASPAPTTNGQWNNPSDTPIGSPGVGVMLQVPALWNPHDVSGSKGTPWRPTNFRFVADSADPITVATSGTYSNVYVAGVAHKTDGKPAYSYTADPTTSLAGQVLNSSNTALTFTDPNGRLFREPTLLLRQGGDMNLQGASVINIEANPVAGAFDPVGTGFLGVIIGRFPLEFRAPDSVKAADGTYIRTMYTGRGIMGLSTITSHSLVYLTYRVQCQDPSGNWITYDTKYGRASNGLADFDWSGGTSIIRNGSDFNNWTWATSIDPRSARFGLFTGAGNRTVAYEIPGDPSYGMDPDSGVTYSKGWIAPPNQLSPDPTKGITFTLRPDKFGGIYFVDFNTIIDGSHYSLNSSDDPVADVPFPQYGAGWSRPVVHAYSETHYEFAPGMYEQNNTSEAFLIRRDDSDNPVIGNDEFGKITGNPQPAYYADADGVVRRAMGAYFPTGGLGRSASPVPAIGLPLAITQNAQNDPTSGSRAANSQGVTDPTQPFNQAQSRPLILNRPFRSQGELGYVFRDTAWKNLDFFTPESGDAALLDVFCVSDTDDSMGRVAGKVNLNTKQVPVIAAILGNACIDDPKVTDTTVGTLSGTAPSTAVTTMATALTNRVADLSASGGPLQNVSELVGRWVGAQPITAPMAYIPQNPQPHPLWNDPVGGDLLTSNGYMDGKLSYTGFAGSNTVTNPIIDLTTAYGAATFSSNTATNASLRTGMTQIQRFHEAPIRALASVGQTRVWNLMIDVVAETGRYPQSATSLDKFMVEGEQRYWVHVSIDRLTGQVIDKQVEVVKE